MFCTKCGASNEDGAMFCTTCGNPLSSGTGTEAADAQINNLPDEGETVLLQPSMMPDAPVQIQVPDAPVQQPVYQAQQQVAQPYGGQQVYNQQPRKIEFKLTKKTIGICAGIGAAILAIVIFIIVGNIGSDPKRKATKFVQAKVEHDWTSAYEALDLPESDFLSKDAFMTVMSNDDNTIVKKVSSISADDVFERDASFGSIIDYDINVMVGYYVEGNTNKEIEYVPMKQMENNFLLFFKQYNIDTNNVVANNITVKAPKDTKLFINGVEVSQAFAKESDNNYISYNIPYLFEGKNKFKIVSDLFGEYEKDREIYDDASFTMSSSSLKYSSAVQENVTKTAEQYLNTILGSAADGKDFSAISGNVHSAKQDTIKTSYDKIVSNFTNNSTYTYKDIKLSDVKTTINGDSFKTDSSTGCPSITVKFTYKLTANATSKKNTATTKTVNGSTTSSNMTLFYDNGTWKIATMSLTSTMS